MVIDIGTLAKETIVGAVDQVAFADAWLDSARAPLLRVPSAIVPESHNVLINPRHPESSTIRIASTRPFAFDRRLWSQST